MSGREPAVPVSATEGNVSRGILIAFSLCASVSSAAEVVPATQEPAPSATGTAGGPELLYVASALGGPGTGRVAAGWPALERYLALGGQIGLFTQRDFILSGAQNTLMAMRVAGDYGLLSWLDLMAAFEGGRNFNDAGPQPIFSYGVDTTLGARVSANLEDLAGSLAASLRLLAGAGSPFWDFAATGLEVRGAGTWAPSALGAERPLRLHGNAAFVLDNSRNIEPGPLPRLYRFATRISEFHRAVLGAAAEWMDPRFAFFTEASVELPLDGRAGLQLFVTPGARLTLTPGLQIQAAVELGFGGNPDYVPAAAPWTASLSVLYTFTPFPRHVVEKQFETKHVVVRLKGGKVKGLVLDQASGAPVADATASFPGSGLSAVLTDAEGHFAAAGIEPGKRPLRVAALGYDEGDLRVEVPEEGEVAVEVKLAKIPEEDYATWAGQVADEQGMPLKAVVSFPRTRRLSPNRFEVEGDFHLRLPPGHYDAEIRSEGKLTTGRRLELGRKEEAKVEVILRAPPAQRAQLTRERITIPQRIEFAFNEDRILPVSFAVLDDVVHVLLEHPEVRVRVEGHTDAVGDPASNLQLSERRAWSVVAYLADKGVDPERLQALGHGPNRPLASNDTDEGRARNRRVEFVVLQREKTR